MTPEPPATRTPAERQAAQAWAFDQIGERYDEAFPHKEGQLTAGEWLIERLPPGACVLDVGCGTGLPTARQLVAAGCDVTGIDISEEMLRLARRDVPEATFLRLDVADVAELGKPDRTPDGYDAIVAFFSMLMLTRAEIPSALRGLHDMLKPGGHFLLSMVEADLDDVPIHFLGSPVWVTGYPRDELRGLVTGAGFEILDMRHLSYAPATTEVPPEIQLFLYSCRDDR
jgi:SAM-dependent methyltransferase